MPTIYIKVVPTYAYRTRRNVKLHARQYYYYYYLIISNADHFSVKKVGWHIFTQKLISKITYNINSITLSLMGIVSVLNATSETRKGIPQSWNILAKSVHMLDIKGK